MQHSRPLALTDEQMKLIRSVAATLPPEARDGFLRGVASHLADEPSDPAVQAAIDIQLQLNRLPSFACDG